MTSFIFHRRLFATKLTVRTTAPYLFDLLGLLLAAGAWLGTIDLRSLTRGEQFVRVSPYDAAMIGCMGLYGIRLSMWLAIIRRNRMPQTAEWLLCLVPLAVALVSVSFSGLLVRSYATAQGYQRCEDGYYNHSRLYLFEPPRVCRRPLVVSHAAIPIWSAAA